MTAALKGASVAQSKADRAERARRARQDGNERRERDAAVKASEAKPAARTRRRTATVTSLPVATVTIPDNAERQAAAALARLQAAEATRPRVNGQPATTTELQEDLRASRVPVARRRSKAEIDRDQAALFDLDAALANMDADFVMCRDMGHGWERYSTRWLAPTGSQGYWESKIRCSHCETIRTRELSKTGALISNGYEYSKGYLVKGMGRLTGSDRDKVRLRSILDATKG